MDVLSSFLTIETFAEKNQKNLLYFIQYFCTIV